jgi:hypothetical protein
MLPVALSNLDLDGRHRRSLSRARQWGRSAEGRGVRFFWYGLGAVFPGELLIGTRERLVKLGTQRSGVNSTDQLRAVGCR